MQGLFFALYAWNAGQVDRNEISQSLVISAESSHLQWNYHQKGQGRKIQKDIKPWITLRQNPHFYLDKGKYYKYGL